MSYQAFQRRINALINKAGGNIKVRFSTDTEKGVHTAVCSDGCKFVASNSCLRIKVMWGSGHTALATL